jgi:hypothetical protein
MSWNASFAVSFRIIVRLLADEAAAPQCPKRFSGVRPARLHGRVRGKGTAAGNERAIHTIRGIDRNTATIGEDYLNLHPDDCASQEQLRRGFEQLLRRLGCSQTKARVPYQGWRISKLPSITKVAARS